MIEKQAELNYALDLNNTEIVDDEPANGQKGEKEMTVVMLEPGKDAYVKRFRGELSDMKALVGGDIETFYPFEDNAVLVCNCGGKVEGLPPNRYIEGELIAGACFICGETADDYTSLDRVQLDAYCKRFSKPDDFSFLTEAGKGEAHDEPVDR